MKFAWIVDIVILGIIAWSIFSGHKKGLVKTVMSCLSLIIAIAISYALGGAVGDVLKETEIFDEVSLTISEELNKGADEYVDNADLSATAENTDIGQFLTGMGVDVKSLYNQNEDIIKDAVKENNDEIVDEKAQVISDALATAAGSLIVFLVAFIALKILTIVLCAVFEIPGLKFVNKVGGSILGAILGFITVCVVVMIINVLLPYIPENPVLYIGMAKDTLLFEFLSAFNPVTLILF